MTQNESSTAWLSNARRHFLDLYSMALADSSVDVSELELLYRIGLENGVSKADIDECITRSEPAEEMIPDTLEMKAEYLYNLVRMAWADGRIDPEEERALGHFCRKFGFKEENVAAIVGFFVEQTQQGVPLEEVKRIVVENA
ncbi:MAG: TerB family tellurite resistance protein [Flavobacteriales bacterium]|nr:TerB family tellurite resistance protein [Flavobacteriales bacterium]MCC6937157.1 TerB family tellurite resistance protein [Flavobacteriales bacterium]